MYYYTYAFLREDRTPYYIGKGKGNRAYRRRDKGIKPPKDKSKILILKQNLTEEESFRHEVYMIAVFGRKDLGTGILHNRTNGGDGVSGAVVSDETRRKMSEALKGKPRSKEIRRKISEAHKGKTHSEESRKNMSESQKGKTFSEETRRKISETRKGKTHSEETKRKLKEINKNRKFVCNIIWTIENIHTKELFEVTNLNEWCRTNNLSSGTLNRTQNHLKQYKGYRIISKSFVENSDGKSRTYQPTSE